MTQHTSKPIACLLHTALFAAFLTLWACSSPTPRPDTPVGQPDISTAPDTAPEQALELPPSHFSSEFESAEFYLEQFDWLSASEVLDSLAVDQMQENDHAYQLYLQSRIDFVRGETDGALAKLRSLHARPIQAGIAYRSVGLQRQILDLHGDDLEAARAALRLLYLAPDVERQLLQQQLWRNMQRADDTALRQALSSHPEPVLQGWLELAQLARHPDVSSKLRLWLQNHPGHPAAANLPGELGILSQPPAAPTRVALLLPLSGRLAPAGKAVRDGYLASYYAASERGEANFELNVYNQDHFPSANAAYETAIADGMELLVGPLSKQAVTQLQQRDLLPIPILALNRTANSSTPSPNFLQHALAPEDEAQGIAEIAFGQGARRALVLRPAGNWGKKVSESLVSRWLELGGSLADDVSFTGREEYSKSVEDGLGIPASQARARRTRDLLQNSVEFTPRRRKDIDVVFLLARSGAEARSLKPLLAFHYAGDLPVYATSSIFGGVADQRDRDLDGVNLVEIPWLLDASNPLRSEIAAGGTSSNAYHRLNALGADAFLLQSHYGVLKSDVNPILRGHTGLLSLNEKGWVERELPLATFDRGVLRPQ